MFMCQWEMQAVTEPDSLSRVSFMLHRVTDLGCLCYTLPLSLVSCPLPVIACQINVPLCSQAQKLSCHIQPPPLFFLIWFSLMPLRHHPSGRSFLLLPLCFHAHTSFPSCSLIPSLPMSTPASALSCFLQALVFFPCAASAVLHALSLPRRWTLAFLCFYLSAGPSTCVCVCLSPH